MIGIVLVFLAAPEPYLLAASDVVWERKPAGAEVDLVIPRSRVTWAGAFKLYCTVGHDGWLKDCFVAQTPGGPPAPEWGVNFARYFRVAPRTRSGLRTEGRTVAMTIKIETADEQFEAGEGNAPDP
ncbi:MAG: hypothetical protein KF842_00705 [Caulobacter sp.]|nr:hypothetical protein [Caulobacter sp.]